MADIETIDDVAAMRLALEQAREGERKGGAAIGCVLLANGVVVAAAHNEVDLGPDPTAHAEIVAIRRAAAQLGDTALRGVTLYSTLQPCGMCTMASIWARIGRIVYGAGREQVHKMYFEDRHLSTMDFLRDAYRDDLTITGGVLAEACAALYHGPDDDPPQEERANV